MWYRLKHFSFALLFLFSALRVPGILVHGQDAKPFNDNSINPLPISTPNMKSANENISNEWTNLKELIKLLKAESLESNQDNQLLSKILAGQSIEINGLSYYLTQSKSQSNDLIDFSNQERSDLLITLSNEVAKREGIEQARDFWRTTALVTGGIVLVGVAIIIVNLY